MKAIVLIGLLFWNLPALALPVFTPDGATLYQMLGIPDRADSSVSGAAKDINRIYRAELTDAEKEGDEGGRQQEIKQALSQVEAMGRLLNKDDLRHFYHTFLMHVERLDAKPKEGDGPQHLMLLQELDKWMGEQDTDNGTSFKKDAILRELTLVWMQERLKKTDMIGLLAARTAEQERLADALWDWHPVGTDFYDMLGLYRSQWNEIKDRYWTLDTCLNIAEKAADGDFALLASIAERRAILSKVYRFLKENNNATIYRNFLHCLEHNNERYPGATKGQLHLEVVEKYNQRIASDPERTPTPDMLQRLWADVLYDEFQEDFPQQSRNAIWQSIQSDRTQPRHPLLQEVRQDWSTFKASRRLGCVSALIALGVGAAFYAMADPQQSLGVPDPHSPTISKPVEPAPKGTSDRGAADKAAEEIAEELLKAFGN